MFLQLGDHAILSITISSQIRTRARCLDSNLQLRVTRTIDLVIVTMPQTIFRLIHESKSRHRSIAMERIIDTRGK